VHRTIALDFSAALDDLFKLNGIGALEEAVEQKYGRPHFYCDPHVASFADESWPTHRKDNVTFRRYELEDLETKLRETDARLKNLEARHRRQQSEQVFSKRKPMVSPVFKPAYQDPEEDSSGDSDAQQGRSPQQYREEK
jgi:hypothetical protein